jgi:ribulose-5-phosphate 4-epimerase/fuculose-1-phosphate aldolase
MDTVTEHVAEAMSDELRAELDKLALACRILEMEGHGSRTLGHAALRDPEGRGIWLKRWGLTLGEVFDHTDFQLIDFDGKLLAGDGKKRHSEWPIHAGILKARDDLNAVAHTHPTYGRIFSASTEKLRPVSNAGSYFFEPPPRYTVTSELIRKPEEGDALAEVLGPRHLAVFLRNHGVVFCGKTVEHMTIIGIHLEEACREMLAIAASGLDWSWPEGEEQERKFGSIGSPRNMALYFQHFANKLAAAQALGHPSLPKDRRGI